MSKTSSKNKTTSWWRHSRNRNKIWGALFVALAVFGLGAFAWLAFQGGQMGGDDDAIAIGRPAEQFTLPDIVSGEEVSLSDYLGKEDIVVVGYMGFF